MVQIWYNYVQTWRWRTISPWMLWGCKHCVTCVELAYAPNVEAVAKTLSRGSQTVKQRLLNHATTCVQPAHSYFKWQLSSSLKVPLVAFKAAWLFSPKIVNVLKPSLVMIDTLTAFPFLKEKIAGLNLLIAYSGGKPMWLNYLCGHRLLS